MRGGWRHTWCSLHPCGAVEILPQHLVNVPSWKTASSLPSKKGPFNPSLLHVAPNSWHPLISPFSDFLTPPSRIKASNPLFPFLFAAQTSPVDRTLNTCPVHSVLIQALPEAAGHRTHSHDSAVVELSANGPLSRPDMKVGGIAQQQHSAFWGVQGPSSA